MIFRCPTPGLLLCAMTLAAGVTATSEKVVPMKFRRSTRSSLAKRQSSEVNVNLRNLKSFYAVDVMVGTPPQPVSLDIDTGSSDVWMLGPESCDITTSECYGNAFDITKSSTATPNEGQFQINYETPGSGVAGNYFQDNFSLGGVTVENLTMAVATQVEHANSGVMGINFPLDESIVGQGGNTYPGLLDVMVTQGLIATRSYSLWLDDLAASTGTILFGGYDKTKFSGNLVILPIQPDAQSGTITSMTVAWSSLSVTDSKGTTALQTNTGFPQAAVLDTGTSDTVVPADIYAQLLTYFNAVPVQGTQVALVQCNMGGMQGSLDFGFGGQGGATISVPFSELAVPGVFPNGTSLGATFSDGSPACFFGLQQGTSQIQILFGDTFLRSAYVVYDLDNQQIGIAPTVFNSQGTGGSSGIGSGNIGGASSIASAVSARQTFTSAALPPPGGLLGSTAISAAPAPVGTSAVGILSGVHSSLTVAALESSAVAAASATFGLGIGGGTSVAAASTIAAPSTVAATGASSSTSASSKGGAEATLPPVQSFPLLVVAFTVVCMLLGAAFPVLA